MATKAATTKKASTSRKTVSTKSTKTTKAAPVVTAPAAVTTGSLPSFSESIRQIAFWRSLVAELIGTFLLAATVIVGQGQPLYILFAFVGVTLLIGTVSGAYVNPATTIAAIVTRRISWIRGIGYVVFQILGALLAIVVINAFVGGAASTVGADGTASATEAFKAVSLSTIPGKEWYVFFSELLGTAILAIGFANALRAGQSRLTSAFTSGLSIFIALMVSFIAASYVGGTAIINPAVAFSLKALDWSVWPISVYIIAPIVGAIVGFLLNDFLKGRATK